MSASELRLHHIGILVPDIPRAVADYCRRFGYQVRTEIVHDPVQTAYVQFLQLPGETSYIEFVAPDRAESKLSNALRKGGGLNHLCYATSDIETACQRLRADGLILLQAPVAAVAFSGRRIAWLMGRDALPIELVERGADGEL
ncbi:MAG TPA: VOC family protein [Chthonomonadaceae bacterium]|nr:VOC family protein [Chthonomonadaceae bacterium]